MVTQVPAFKVSSESVAALLAVPLNHLSDYLNYLNVRKSLSMNPDLDNLSLENYTHFSCYESCIS